MTDFRFPVCPICKQEILLPFSVSQDKSTKTYASWVCSNCGFYLTTGDTRGIYPELDDIKAGINPDLRKKVEEIRKQHYKKQI